MADKVDPALASSLSAPGSDVPTQQSSPAPQTAQHKETQSPQSYPEAPQEPKEENEAPGTAQKSAKGKESGPAPSPAPASTDGAADGAEKLSPAEMKKRAKAEKAARRAREKVEREQGGAGSPGQGGGGGGTPNAKKGQPGKDAGLTPQPQKGQRPLPRRGSAQNAAQAAGPEQKKKKEEKNVAVFGHLYGQQRRTTVAGAGKEVHPAVLALGLQMRDYVVCGSSARCVATLLAFKRVC
jgi:translation initiation factor eIF-2B subunit delta